MHSDRKMSTICLEISTRALSVISLSIAPLLRITLESIDELLLSRHSEDINDKRSATTKSWSDRWYRWQQLPKMVSDATASLRSESIIGRVRRLNGLNDPMMRHDISSKLRSGLKSS
jgi:hypothetical protein